MAEEAHRVEMENERHQMEENQGGQTSNEARNVEPVIPYIKLCIRSQDGDECYYRVRRDKRLGNLLFSFCHEKHINFPAAAFICDGQRVKPTQTPDELGMDDEDVIDVMLRQTGGGY